MCTRGQTVTQPSQALRLGLYYFIELNEYAVWVEGKSTANLPCGRLDQRVRWHDKFHPFEVFVDRIKTMDPEPNVRDAYLIGLNTRARKMQRAFQISDRQFDMGEPCRSHRLRLS